MVASLSTMGAMCRSDELAIGMSPAGSGAPKASALKSTFNAPAFDWIAEPADMPMPVAESTRSDALPPAFFTTWAAVSKTTPRASCSPSALRALLPSTTSVERPSAPPRAVSLT
jgi:hypothetical protein